MSFLEGKKRVKSNSFLDAITTYNSYFLSFFIIDRNIIQKYSLFIDFFNFYFY